MLETQNIGQLWIGRLHTRGGLVSSVRDPDYRAVMDRKTTTRGGLVSSVRDPYYRADGDSYGWQNYH